MGRGLVNHLLKVANCIHPRLSSSVVLQIVRFTRKCFYIHKHQGTKGLTLYLKACQVLLQQSIGKYIVKDIKDLKARPKRNRYGSPLIIHRSIRPLIHTKYSKTHIMLWMTLLGIFRVLEFKGKLSLDTITKPFELNPKTLNEWRDFILNDFKQTLLRGKLPSSKSIDLYPISTSSPTSIVLKGFSNRSPSVISTHFASL